jgi:adenine-specific DNA-methyltransferase
MPTLEWIGKENVVNHHLEVPFRVLNHEYGFSAQGTLDDPTQSGNKIIHGDNLEALKALLPEYEAQIKCIYIDPPYNTGQEEWCYNDNLTNPAFIKWLGKVVGKPGEDLSRHDKWLCMMYPRIKLLHKLLRADGAIFISVDHNELSHLKMIMDEVFGERNFIELFSWHKTKSPSNLSHKTKKCIDYVLCYEKRRNDQRFKGLKKVNDNDNPLIKKENSISELIIPKEAITVKLSGDIDFPAGSNYGTKINPITLKKPTQLRNGKFTSDLHLEGPFVWQQSKLDEELLRDTKILIKQKSLAPRYDKASYSEEVPRNYINEDDDVGTTEEGGSILKKLFGKKAFDYPKTPSLIRYMLNFVCGPNDIVLDSFAGSGTTAHAVMQLNAEDQGNRKFILIEIMDYADHLTAERVKRVMASPDVQQAPNKTFDFFTLGPALFLPNGTLNPAVNEADLRRYIYHVETRKPLPENRQKSNAAYLGAEAETAYYFIFNKHAPTLLNTEFLSTIQQESEHYVVYADRCTLSDDFMDKHHVTFKKIPRDLQHR